MGRVWMRATAAALGFLAILWSGSAGAAPGGAYEPVTVRRASLPPVIDGKLAEWNWPAGQWAALAWDTAYLYLAADLIDGTREVNDDHSRDFAGSDRVVLLLSTAPVTPSAPAGERLGEQDFAFVLVPESLYQRPLKTLYGFGGFEHVELDLRQVTVAGGPTAQGYTLEARIPWAALGIDPQPGQALYLEVVAFDVRKGQAPRVTTLSGQPLGPGIGHHLLRPATLSAE